MNFIFLQTIFELNPHQRSAQYDMMKNKRLVHGKLIANFQEKSQQEEVVRHDMIDMMEVRRAFFENRIKTHCITAINYNFPLHYRVFYRNQVTLKLVRHSQKWCQRRSATLINCMIKRRNVKSQNWPS